MTAGVAGKYDRLIPRAVRPNPGGDNPRTLAKRRIHRAGDFPYSTDRSSWSTAGSRFPVLICLDLSHCARLKSTSPVERTSLCGGKIFLLRIRAPRRCGSPWHLGEKDLRKPARRALRAVDSTPMLVEMPRGQWFERRAGAVAGRAPAVECAPLTLVMTMSAGCWPSPGPAQTSWAGRAWVECWGASAAHSGSPSNQAERPRAPARPWSDRPELAARREAFRTTSGRIAGERPADDPCWEINQDPMRISWGRWDKMPQSTKDGAFLPQCQLYRDQECKRRSRTPLKGVRRAGLFLSRGAWLVSVEGSGKLLRRGGWAFLRDEPC